MANGHGNSLHLITLLPFTDTKNKTHKLLEAQSKLTLLSSSYELAGLGEHWALGHVFLAL